MEEALLIMSYITMEVICAQCVAIFVVTHFIIIAAAYRWKSSPTRACLEEHTLTELNETHPPTGLTRQLLINHPDTVD